jgi:ketosteroid isomerase-like protein
VADDSESLVRSAFVALMGGNLDAALELVDPDLEWTYLDPSQQDPEPAVCHGREQLRYWAGRAARHTPPALDELVSYGERVLVVTRWPEAIDERRDRTTGDRNFHVVTVRGGRITALRACRSREEAARLASAPAGEGGT